MDIKHVARRETPLTNDKKVKLTTQLSECLYPQNLSETNPEDHLQSLAVKNESVN